MSKIDIDKIGTIFIIVWISFYMACFIGVVIYHIVNN